MVGPVMIDQEKTLYIYFGNDRYLLKTSYYAKDAEWDTEAQQRGWEVNLFDAKDGKNANYREDGRIISTGLNPVLTFFTWWYADTEYGLSEQGDNEEFTIQDPYSDAAIALLKILEEVRDPTYSEITESSNAAYFAAFGLKDAIISAQDLAGPHSINNRWIP